MWGFTLGEQSHRGNTSRTGTNTPKFVRPALLQKLVGEFLLDFPQGDLVGNLAGNVRDFLDPRNKGSNMSGKNSEHFS